MHSIHARFQYTESEAIKATQEITNEFKFYIRYFPLIGGIVLASAVIYTIFHGIPEIPGFAIFFGGFMILMPFFIRREGKRRFKNSPSANQMISWQFSENLLETQTPGAQASFEWNKLVKVVQVKDGFLLFVQDRLAHWIPAHAFSSTEDLDAIDALIEGSGVKYKKHTAARAMRDRLAD